MWSSTHSINVFTCTELEVRSCQVTGYRTLTPPFRSTPGTLLRELLYNTAILWRSNIRSQATVPGCTTILAAFTPRVAATTTKQHVQLKTLLLVSGSSRSCEVMLWLNCKTNLQQFNDWKRLIKIQYQWSSLKILFGTFGKEYNKTKHQKTRRRKLFVMTSLKVVFAEIILWWAFSQGFIATVP